MTTPPIVQERLDQLNALTTLIDPAVRSSQIKYGLGHYHNRVVGKAAALCAEYSLHELIPDLFSAYRHFLHDAVKEDPHCVAKQAIARALVALECTDVPFFLEGIRYEQREPQWGGTMDTAIDIRCSCAMGLVASHYPRALIELAQLLDDPEGRARAGAVRAIACSNPTAAEALLRFKSLCNDPEVEVTGECFAQLLGIEPELSIPFVAARLSDRDESIREQAAYALGESCLAAALPCLQSAWEDASFTPDFQGTLIRAVALHRSDGARDWLISLIQQAQPREAAKALAALAIYKENSMLTERIRQVLVTRNNDQLLRSFNELWAATT